MMSASIPFLLSFLCLASGVRYNYRGGKFTNNQQFAVTDRLGLLGPSLGLPAVPGAEIYYQPSHEKLEGQDQLPPVAVDPPTLNTQGTGRGCYCVPRPNCIPGNNDGTGIIDIRIVNTPPTGVSCGSNDVYCCVGTDPTPSKGCGVSNPISIPGVALSYGQAEFGEYPWVVILLGRNNEYRGAGALIDNRHVLTTAHKVREWSSDSGLKIRLGDWDAANNNEPNTKIEVEAQWVRSHPNFNSGNLQNDVAVIRLKTPVQVSSYPNINTVCLPTQGFKPGAGESSPKSKKGKTKGRKRKPKRKCWVAGWGKDAFGPSGSYQSIMKEVEVTFVGSDDCESKLRSTRLGTFFQLDKSSFICAGGDEGKDACTGDGGSPLVCKIGGRFTMVGMVAWGIGCAMVNVPGVYVNVPNYIDWIQQQTNVS